MKAPTTLAILLGAAVASRGDARPMHAGINYQRYLQEREDTKVELEAWKTKFGATARQNGWMPVQEDRSADDDDEDLLQRFFMTKQNITELQALNPKANFSTDSPFSLMTNDEFSSFVNRGFRTMNSTTRRLRGGWGNFGHVSNLPPSQGKTTTTQSSGSRGTTTTTTTESSSSGATYKSSTTTTDGDGVDSYQSSWTSTWSSTSAPSTESTGDDDVWGSASGWGNYDFSDFWNNWWGESATVEPAGPSDSETTSAPVATSTSAPVATTSAPVATTAAPKATTAAPKATTAAPTTTAPSTVTSAPAATTESTDSVAADSDTTTSSSSSVDWTDTPCVSAIQYQGNCGDCWAFASVSALESLQCIQNGKTSVTKYSEQQVVSCSSNTYGCNGGAPEYAIEYAQQSGLCTEADYPYTSGEGSVASCGASSCNSVSMGISGYDYVDSPTALAERVAQQPVIIAVYSSDNAWKQYTGGVLSSCSTNMEPDHAVVVVGYTDTEWKIRNSWGETWGEQGYMRMERQDSGYSGDGICSMYNHMQYPVASS